MNCVWRWCDNQLPEPVENVFCSEKHAKKWVKTFDSNPRAAMEMVRKSGLDRGTDASVWSSHEHITDSGNDPHMVYE